MTDMVHATAPASARVSDSYRWTQLAIGVAAMVMIANYQYGWTFFVPDIQKTFGWDRASHARGKLHNLHLIRTAERSCCDAAANAPCILEYDIPSSSLRP